MHRLILYPLICAGLWVSLSACSRRPPAPIVEVPPTPAIEEPASLGVETIPEPVATPVFNPILFDFAQAELVDELTPAFLLDYLHRNPTARVHLSGYACELGDESLNWALSEARAAAVRAYLVWGDIDASRIETSAYGEEYPLGGDLRLDRRVEIRIGGR